MLSMLKLSLATIVASSTLFASSVDADLEEFLTNKFKNNPRVIDLKVNVVDKTLVKEITSKYDKDKWYAYVIKIKAKIDNHGKKRDMTQKMIWFSNGTMITQDFIDMDTSDSLKNNYHTFDKSFYRKENLIYGHEDAKHKVAIFSDPLCPFCKIFVPKAIKEMKEYPNKFAIYYYHFPLPALHPAAVTLTKAAIVAEQMGIKDVILNLYKVKIKSSETDDKKILKAFNKTMNTNITLKDIKSSKVKKQYKFDQDVAEDVMVAGTPTIFFDGRLDNSKRKYKNVK